MTEKVIEAKHRLEMVRLATSNNPHFSTSDVELSRPGKSYSVDTIRFFRERRQDALFFILGSDAFVEIETWKEFQNLFSLCDLIVMTRPGSQKNSSSSPLPRALIPSFRYDSGENAWIHMNDVERPAAADGGSRFLRIHVERPRQAAKKRIQTYRAEVR